jgi:hypothetical protein
MPLCDGFYCNREATCEGRWDRGGQDGHAFYCKQHGEQAAKDPRVAVTPLELERS